MSNIDEDAPVDGTIVLDVVGEVDEVRPTRPSAWLTIGLTLAVFGAYAVAQSLVIGAFLAIETRRDPSLNVDAWLERAMYNGKILAAGTVVGAAATLPLIFLFARWANKSRSAAREHLGLRPASLGSVLRWLTALAAFMAALYAVTWIADRQQIPEFMEEIYKTAGLSAPLVVAIVIVAPLYEELLFRGLLYGGLAPSAIRPVGAAIISSLAWAAIHVQYDLFTIASIFVAGLLLAAARQKTQSVFVCIIMHAALNLIATVELALVMTQRP